MRRLLCIAILALATLPLAACGEKSEPSASDHPGEPQQLRLALDSAPTAAHATLYAAIESGGMARAGLAVDTLPPGRRSALDLVAAGRADVALASEPALLAARRGVGGADLVAVGALVPRPLTGVVALDSARVKTLADLRGKRIGMPRGEASTEQQAMLSAAGVKADAVRRLPPAQLVDALEQRKLDAAVGVRIDAAVAELGRRGRKLTTLRADEAGVPTYPELALVARRKALDTDGAAQLRRLLQALRNGQRLVADDRGAALDALLKADRTLDRRAMELALERVVPLLTPTERNRPYGYVRRTQWTAFGRWLERVGGVGAGAAGALTNEFLPGEGFAGGGEPHGAPGVAPEQR